MVRLLEQRIGFTLFRRQANALELTAQGGAFLTGLSDSFDSIARLAEQVAAMRAGPVLTVGVGPTLAVNWLIPRLNSFYRSNPEIEVRMATGGATRPVRDDWTCTIRRDASAWPGHVAEKLFPSALIPVCSPALAASLRHPSDLRTAPLIVVPHLSGDWPSWFEAAGLRGADSAGSRSAVRQQRHGNAGSARRRRHRRGPNSLCHWRACIGTPSRTVSDHRDKTRSLVSRIPAQSSGRSGARTVSRLAA